MQVTLTFQHSLAPTLLLDEINVCPPPMCGFDFQSVDPQ